MNIRPTTAGAPRNMSIQLSTGAPKNLLTTASAGAPPPRTGRYRPASFRILTKERMRQAYLWGTPPQTALDVALRDQAWLHHHYVLVLKFAQVRSIVTLS